MHMVNVRFVAEHIAGLNQNPLQDVSGDSLPSTTPKVSRPRRKAPPPQETAVETPSHTTDVTASKTNKNADLWGMVREQVAQNKEIASMQTQDILARFKKDVEKSQGMAVAEQ